MSKITISKTEYSNLKKQSKAYRVVMARLFELLIKDPVKSVVDDFRKIGLYSDGFLSDLEAGLRKSSYGG
ncbi:hypothetical protein KGQ27_00640 [Patescibacteria group bacterium]|nr:hypothetical protein [Patescibacteria group bacterium]MDE1946854.1 hypothetical protein [Patescibacteria group bacterium]MDE2010674.1 hypothetical protein [Patescibacteria group bacterium]MDE2232720.1 hypothetical protein [Patescibacteria group bacterium]